MIRARRARGMNHPKASEHARQMGRATALRMRPGQVPPDGASVSCPWTGPQNEGMQDVLGEQGSNPCPVPTPYKHCGDAPDFQSGERGSIPRYGSAPFRRVHRVLSS